jgi:hypothetical protein
MNSRRVGVPESVGTRLFPGELDVSAVAGADIDGAGREMDRLDDAPLGSDESPGT